LGLMMKILKYNRYRYLITPAVILVFLSSSTAYPAPDLCLRQRAAVERPPQTPEANIARAQALLSRLNIKVGECIRQLKVIKAEIARNPTEGNQKWRGLIADRLMLILKDMRALKAYIIRAYGPLEPFPDIRLENYIEDIPCPPGEAVQYEFLPARYIRPASASSEIRKRHMKKTVNVLMAGGAGTRLQELYHMTPTERKLAGAGDLSTEELKNVSKPTIPYTPIMHKSPIVVIIESLRRIAQDEGDTPVVIIPGPDTNVPILKALRKNKWFGLKKVIIKNQGTLPVYNAHYADSQQLLNNGGPVEYEPNGPFIEAPDGGGGTLMALGKKGILVAINGKEAVLADKSAWSGLTKISPPPRT
jgi:hypothetical protein